MNRYLLPGLKLVAWLVALLGPIEWCVLLGLDDRYHVVAGRPHSLVGLVDSLTPLIPLIALLVCGYVVWCSKMTTGWKVTWTAFSFLVILLQVVALLEIAVVVTGYAQ
jgi:hypothetical protein